MTHISKKFGKDGISFSHPQPDWLANPLDYGAENELVAFLGQLAEESFADYSGELVFIQWKNVYQLLDSPTYRESVSLFGLPPMKPWRPILKNEGSLTDTNFSIFIDGWVDPGEPYRGDWQVEGAVLSMGQSKIMLPRETWETVRACREFHERERRDADSNRRGWADIHRHAIAAKADLSNFLKNTVVLTPEQLKLTLRKVDFDGRKVVEVIPGFDGQPPRWLEIFDRFDRVLERYEIPDGKGLTHVLVSPEVKTVLQEIKRMPGRRVAGDRAERFIRNPFSALGLDEKQKVIDPGEFEQALDIAGISFARFTARVLRYDRGFPYEYGLNVEETIGGEIRSKILRFDGVETLKKFVDKLQYCIDRNAPSCFWEGYDLEILGDTPDQLALLTEALRDIQNPDGFSVSEIFDLSRYSKRVGGFGTEQSYYSPFIARKSDGAGWFPENIVFGLSYESKDGKTIALTLNEEMLGQFRDELQKARDEQRESFPFPGCPDPIKVSDAEKMLKIFEEAGKDVSNKSFDPNNPKVGSEVGERKGLVVKPNVATLDYEERRGALAPAETTPRLPRSLKSGNASLALKDHQLEGIAWLQHLWSLSPAKCRGAMLADDMGLGKTIQLLAFIAECIEREPLMEPFLIVAPVALLENWKEEIDKFFEPGAIPVLTLYGSTLSEMRVDRRSIDEELTHAGISKLLRRNWLGTAKVVLTTYETLRDLEFSLAMQKWSGMVCDEAQKIKNPNALVSRAAKKQNARFKIACTGTPVENTLTDLWCLFDFMQPGLLGALNEFGSRYRKPIEAKTDDEKKRVKELRTLIEPQIKRRLKADVAKDLPRKTIVDDCRKLPLSEKQRAHYANAIGQFRCCNNPAKGLKNHLGLLQYLRRLCSDPRPPGQLSTDIEPLDEILRNSPKMAWLISQIQKIKSSEEKAIVFCEFRDLQRTLQRAIAERFGDTPDIINGETLVNSKSSASRQKRIKAFQQKGGFGVIILSPLAVGFGLNIQAANHVIHFMRLWNPAKEDQATDRAYRIGQTKDVYVYCPVVVADDFITFDAKLDSLLEWKRGLSNDMLNGTGDLSPGNFGDLQTPGGGSAFGTELLTRADIIALDPDAFEAFCAVLWTKHGFKTYKTPRVGDGGVDVVALKEKGELIQCKSSSIDGHKLGWEAVRDVAAGTAAYASRHPGRSFTKVAATNQFFNDMAKAQANINHVRLVDQDGLVEMLEKTPVTQSELNDFLFSGWEE